jgi:hypothetical protein
MEEPNSSGGIGVKLIALLLIVGGCTGAIFTLANQYQAFFNAGLKLAAVYGIFVLLFGWSAWTGYGLWKGKAWAIRNAKFIFAA